MIRSGLHYTLTALGGSVEFPALLVLGSEARGLALPEPELTAVKDALRLAPWRRSTPATEYTGTASRVTFGSWATGSKAPKPDKSVALERVSCYTADSRVFYVPKHR
jgi:hypothetical protein